MNTSTRETARQWLDAGCVFYDCESSGIDQRDVACDIAVLAADGRVLFESLVALPPGIEMSPGAFAVHGLGPDVLATAPKFTDVFGELVNALSHKPIVTFNESFDHRIFNQTRAAWGLYDFPGVGLQDWHCAMLLSQTAMGVRKWPRLDEAADRFLVKALGVHRARVDAETCRQIVLKIAGVI